MFTCSSFQCCVVVAFAFATLALGQDAAVPLGSEKVQLDHVVGTITAVDSAAKTVTVQEDKTATVHVVQLANTKTLLKVEPTAKDLKAAVRITASDLATGDRVDVRGTKLEDTPTTLNARAVILMSARDLEATHQQQSAAWAHATAGRVTAVDPATGKIMADVRAAREVKPVTVQTSGATEFTRYSANSGKADPSQLSQVEVGDQVKIVGTASDDGTTLTAQRLYSGAFRTISATIVTLGADGKSMTVKDLATKKSVEIALTGDAAIHRLPPTMAGFLARRLNPNAAAPAGAPGASSGPPAGGPGTSAPPAAGLPPSGNGSGVGGGGGRGDISQMLERLPKIAITDLKAGDALVISGVATAADNSHIVANTLIAGVEPILQSAPQQRGGGRSVGGDWGLGEMSAPQ